jgi:hypothetical protein
LLKAEIAKTLLTPWRMILERLLQRHG